MDINTLHSMAQREAKSIFSFLRDLVAIPSLDGQEGAVIRRTEQEMRRCGFDHVSIDKFGNCVGRIGQGPRTVIFDAHMDTVGTGDLKDWSFDPFVGKEDEDYIYGRGSCDQKAGMAAMVYAGKLMRQIGIPPEYSVLFVGSVLEEDCEGLCWEHLLGELHSIGMEPAWAVSTEATDMNVYIGHRGRVDLSVQVRGRSAHGAMPWLGSNALEHMSEIIAQIQLLKDQAKVDGFLGQGTYNISSISSDSPSKCAVPDLCEIKIDRRLTLGESPQSAVQEIQALPAVQKYGATVAVETFRGVTWTRLPVETPCEFPVWKTEPNSPLCQTALQVVEAVTGQKKQLGKWNFSTNGVSLSGRHHIPCIGIGPGREEQAHAPDEYVSKAQILQAVQAYVALVLQEI